MTGKECAVNQERTHRRNIGLNWGEGHQGDNEFSFGGGKTCVPWGHPDKDVE